MTLNNNGFYELQEVDTGETEIIRLLINSTMGANGSSVACVDTSDGNAIIGQTSLQVYGKLLCRCLIHKSGAHYNNAIYIYSSHSSYN